MLNRFQGKIGIDQEGVEFLVLNHNKDLHIEGGEIAILKNPKKFLPEKILVGSILNGSWLHWPVIIDDKTIDQKEDDDYDWNIIWENF